MTSLLRMPPGVKPTYPVEIDWDHPLAKGLMLLSVPQTAGAEARDLLSPEPLSLYDRQLTAIDDGGPHLVFNNSAYIEYGTDYSYAANLTFLMVANVTDVGFLGTKHSTSGGSYGWWFGIIPGPTLEARGSTNGSDNNGGVSLAITTLDEVASYVYRYDSSTVDGFINGENVVSNATTGALYNNTSINLRVGNRSGSNYPMDGNAYMYAMWDRPLTDSEIMSISNDPYQLLKPAASALNHPALAITTPTTYDDGLRVPDPKWEAPAILVPGVKPTGPVAIDRESFVSWYTSVWLFTNPSSTTLGRPVTAVADKITINSRGNICAEWSNGSSLSQQDETGLNLEMLKPSSNRPAVSFIAIYYYDSTSGSQNVLEFGGSSDNQIRIWTEHNNNRESLTIDNQTFIMTTKDPGNWIITVGRWVQGGNVDVWRNGVKVVDGVTATGTWGSPSTVDYLFGAGNRVDLLEFMAIDMDAAWPDSICESLHLDPYQFLIPA